VKESVKYLTVDNDRSSSNLIARDEIHQGSNNAILGMKKKKDAELFET